MCGLKYIHLWCIFGGKSWNVLFHWEYFAILSWPGCGAATGCSVNGLLSIDGKWMHCTSTSWDSFFSPKSWCPQGTAAATPDFKHWKGGPDWWWQTCGCCYGASSKVNWKYSSVALKSCKRIGRSDVLNIICIHGENSPWKVTVPMPERCCENQNSPGCINCGVLCG